MWKFVSADHFRRSLRGRMPSLAKRCVAGGEQRVVRLALDGGRDRQIGGDARIRWPAVHAECFDYVGAGPVLVEEVVVGVEVRDRQSPPWTLPTSSSQ